MNKNSFITKYCINKQSNQNNTGLHLNVSQTLPRCSIYIHTSTNRKNGKFAGKY